VKLERNMASQALKPPVKKAPVTDEFQPQSTTETEPQSTVDQTAIAARAYELWQERGSPIGSPEADWFRAVEELKIGDK
jgi:hypothetical protein